MPLSSAFKPPPLTHSSPPPLQPHSFQNSIHSSTQDLPFDKVNWLKYERTIPRTSACTKQTTRRLHLAKQKQRKLKFSTNSNFILLRSTIRRSLIQKRRLKQIDKSLFGKSKRLLFIMISSEFVLTKDKPEKSGPIYLLMKIRMTSRRLTSVCSVFFFV